MFLDALASAFPQSSYTQPECLEFTRETDAFQKLSKRGQGILGRVLGGESGISKRHFSTSQPAAMFDAGAQELNEFFEREAPKLSVEAFLNTGVDVAEIDALIVCTCTGYLCPGVSSHVAEQLGMRDDVYLQDIVGLGCGAAIPMMRAAEGFLAANPGKKVATIAVEICSAALYVNEDPGVLISLCLFGDGAAAAVEGVERAERPLVRQVLGQQACAAQAGRGSESASDSSHDGGGLGAPDAAEICTSPPASEGAAAAEL